MVWRHFGLPDLNDPLLQLSLAARTDHRGAAKLNDLSRRLARYISPGVNIGEYASRTTILFGGKTTEKTMESTGLTVPMRPHHFRILQSWAARPVAFSHRICAVPRALADETGTWRTPPPQNASLSGGPPLGILSLFNVDENAPGETEGCGEWQEIARLLARGPLICLF